MKFKSEGGNDPVGDVLDLGVALREVEEDPTGDLHIPELQTVGIAGRLAELTEAVQTSNEIRKWKLRKRAE